MNVQVIFNFIITIVRNMEAKDNNLKANHVDVEAKEEIKLYTNVHNAVRECIINFTDSLKEQTLRGS